MSRSALIVEEERRLADASSRPELSSEVVAKPSTPATPPPPASVAAAAPTPLPAAAAAAAPVPAPAAAAPASAPAAPAPEGTYLAPSETVDAGARGGCPQDPKASGLDVLVGAVDIELKRAGPVAQTPVESAPRLPTGASTHCRPLACPVAAGAHPPAAAPASPSLCSAVDVGALAGGQVFGGDAAAAYQGSREEEEAACRTLKTLPHGFFGHAPRTGGGMPEAGTAGGRSMPGFSMAAGSAPPRFTSFSTPGATAAASSPGRSTVHFAPAPGPAPSIGPTARDAYLAAAAVRAAITKASLGLAPAPDDDRRDFGRYDPATVGTAGKAAATATAKAGRPSPMAAKTKVAVRAKARAKTKAKAKSNGTGAAAAAAAKGGGKARRTRRGPAGQSHFKGVCITPSGTWRAVIYVDRRQIYLGVFDSEFDAARAYDAAAILHFPGGPPHLNNPDAVERQLNELSAGGGKPFSTAGAPEIPELEPWPLRFEGPFDARERA